MGRARNGDSPSVYPHECRRWAVIDTAETIDLVQVMSALREQLGEAAKAAEGQNIQFPVTSLQLEFQVGVTVDEQAKGGLKFAILELGASGGYPRESIQTVTLNLAAPVYA